MLWVKLRGCLRFICVRFVHVFVLFVGNCLGSAAVKKWF